MKSWKLLMVEKKARKKVTRSWKLTLRTIAGERETQHKTNTCANADDE